MSDRTVVLVVPPISGGRLDDKEIIKWLSRGEETVSPREDSLLARVLFELGISRADRGLAALRYLGDMGQAAGEFICAADPIHFQTRMRDLVVQELPAAQVSVEEVTAIFDTLQGSLGSETGTRFEAHGRRGYVLHSSPFDTSDVSTREASGTVADRFMPSGSSAGDYHRLQSEIQMVLHDHPVNSRRDERGQPRISALWLWGGGSTPAKDSARLPTYSGSHGLLRGYWIHEGGHVANADKTTLADVFGSPSGAVADLTQAAEADLIAGLGEAKRLLARGSIRKLSVVSQDGFTIRLNRWNTWRFWNTGSKLMDSAHAGL